MYQDCQRRLRCLCQLLPACGHSHSQSSRLYGCRRISSQILLKWMQLSTFMHGCDMIFIYVSTATHDVLTNVQCKSIACVNDIPRQIQNSFLTTGRHLCADALNEETTVVFMWNVKLGFVLENYWVIMTYRLSSLLVHHTATLFIFSRDVVKMQLMQIDEILNA